MNAYDKCVPGHVIATFGSKAFQQQISTKLVSDVTQIMNSQTWDPENVRPEMPSTLVKESHNPWSSFITQCAV